MSKEAAEALATVTFAMYDETPIACQGDDDQKKIRVITNNFVVSEDIHGDALKRSVVLGTEHGTYVQVWDVVIKY
jgi:hypothetical protein